MKNQQISLIERASKYLRENDKLLKSNALTARLIVFFPGRKNPPFWSKCALWLVGQQGGKLDMQFDEIKK